MKDTKFRIEYDDRLEDIPNIISEKLESFGLTIEELDGGDGFMEYQIVNKKFNTNPIEDAINGTDADLDFYLEEVTKEEFKSHIDDLKKRYADKQVIENAINELIKLI